MFSITGARVVTRLHRPVLSSLALFVSGCVFGCSESDADPQGAAGSGTLGSAGTSGGQTGSSGSGGSPATGGTAGTSAGGAGGGGAAPTTEPIIIHDFAAAADVEGWQFAYADPITLIPQPVVADAGEVPAQEGVASAAHDSMGDPMGNPGSIRVELPFGAPLQKISFEVSVASDAGTPEDPLDDVGVDLRGHSISARIAVLSGYSADPVNPPGLKLYVKTGAAFYYADSGYMNIALGSAWQTFSFANVSTPLYPIPPYPADFNPADVRLIGIEFDTGAAGAYSPATVLLDSVAVY